VNRLRNRLIGIFLAATLAPLAATIWITTSLLEESVDTSSTSKLDTVSKSLKGTARELYQRASDDVKHKAQAGEIQPKKYGPLDRASWPDPVRVFSGGLEGDRVVRRATAWTTWCATATRSGCTRRAWAMWPWIA
jgi:two-component system nitrogen regulation sensor histidine kinase NtrY